MPKEPSQQPVELEPGEIPPSEQRCFFRQVSEAEIVEGKLGLEQLREITADEKLKPESDEVAAGSRKLKKARNEIATYQPSAAAVSRLGIYTSPRINLLGVDWRMFLLRVPKFLEEAINTGNSAAIGPIFDQVAVENCILVNPSFPRGIVGRKHVSEMFSTLLRLHPDYTLIIRSSKLVDGVIEAKTFATGTRVFDDAKSYYARHFDEREDAASIRAQGGHYTFHLKVILCLFFFTKFYLQHKVHKQICILRLLHRGK